MRKLIKIVLGLLTVIVIAAVAMPFLIPVETYKQEIAAQVKKATGRDLIIAGTMRASVLPALGVDIENASLSNPVGFINTQMLQVEKLSVEVELLPLLSKQIQIKRFVLDKPVINLEVDVNGTPNWGFSSTTTPDPTPAATEDTNASALLAGFMIGDVRISDGQINYRDARTKKTMALSSVNLKTAFSGFSDPFHAEGDAVWNGEKITIQLGMDDPSQLTGIKTSPFSLAVKSSPVTLNYKGAMSLLGANGKADLAITSLPKLVQWTGGTFAWKGATPLAFSAEGELNCGLKSCTFKDGTLTLDAIKAKGNVSASFGGKPSIEAALVMETLDMNPYLLKQHASTHGLVLSALAMEPWSNEHIDLSGLNAVNAKLVITTGSLLYNNIKMGKTSLTLNLTNGVLKNAIPNAEFYGGNVTANASMDASGAFTKQVEVANVKAEPFLKDATGDDRFSGTLNMSTTVSGKLTSIRDMVAGLSGNGSIKLTDGAVKGVDLAGMVRNIQSAYKDVDTAQQKTDFSELGGTFTIANGIVSNNDLVMKAPLLRLSGKGTIDLPLQMIHYRLTPEIVQTIQGQGGKEKQGLEVPVIVEGPLDRPSFTPDLAGMAQKALENPQAIKDTVKSVKEQIKENKGAVKDLLKGLGGR